MRVCVTAQRTLGAVRWPPAGGFGVPHLGRWRGLDGGRPLCWDGLPNPGGPPAGVPLAAVGPGGRGQGWLRSAVRPLWGAGAPRVGPLRPLSEGEDLRAPRPRLLPPGDLREVPSLLEPPGVSVSEWVLLGPPPASQRAWGPSPFPGGSPSPGTVTLCPERSPVGLPDRPGHGLCQ